MFWLLLRSASLSQGLFGVSELPVRRHARRGEGAGQDSCQRSTPTTKHHVQYKLGAGGWEGLDTEGEQAGHQSVLGSSCIGHHWFLWSLFLDFFITIIITISSSIFYFVSVIKFFLAQTMHFLLFSQFSSPSQQGRGSEWLCGWG